MNNCLASWIAAAERKVSGRTFSCLTFSLLGLVIAIGGTAQAATQTIDVGTVHTNSASSISAGSTIVVPEGAALDMHTVQNNTWFDYKYSVTIAGSGPDGLGALRNTGTLDPKTDDPQISNITLTGDALIKSSRYMALLAQAYAEAKLMLNNHTLTIDMDEGKNFALFHSGPWNTSGTVKLINGVLLVPMAKNGNRYYFTDYEAVTVVIEGPKSVLNVTGTGAGIYVKNLLMSDSATLVGDGFIGINSGTFKPSETDSAFTGLLRIWGNITIDLSGLDGAWKFPRYDFYKCSSSTLTLTPAEWAMEGSGGKKIINWASPPELVSFQLDSAHSANWRLVKRIDGLYIYPADFPFYALRDIASSSWKFYRLDWTDVTASCGIAEPTDEQTVCFSSAAEYDALKALTFSSREVMLRSCSLSADASFTEIPFVISSDATIDVAGHKMTAPATAAAHAIGGIVTSSAAGGVLELNASQGSTNAVIFLSLTGGANLQLWKTGAGRLSMEKSAQSFGANGAVSCVVKEGVLAKKNATSTFWGAQYSTIRVENGAQADIMGGMYWDYDYHIAGDGPDGKGAIVCGVSKSGFYNQSTTYAHLRHIVLEDDATIGGDYMWALSFYNNGTHNITLNGHTLTVGNDNFVYWISLNPQDSGKLMVGRLEVFQSNANLANVDVEVKYCLASNAGNFFNPVKSLKYEAGAGWYVSGGASDSFTTVYETYRPGKGTMPSVELGAAGHLTPTLDLSTQADTLDGTKLTFAGGATVRVETGARKLSNGQKLVSWTEKPSESVKFVLAGRSIWRVATRDDGLYVYAGMCIFVR